VNWLLCIVGAALALIAVFIFAPEKWHPALIFSTAVLGGAAGLTTAVNALDARSSAAKQAQIAGALAFAERWNSPTFYHCKKAGREIIQHFRTIDVEQQIKYLAEDSGRFANLIDLINQFEALSIAIGCGTVDDDTARLFFRAIVIEYWHATESYTKKRRAEKGNPRLYLEFETLYGRWKN